VKNRFLALATAGVLAGALSACGSNSGSTLNQPHPMGLPTQQPTNPTTPTGTYTQIELLSRPAVKEVFEQFNDHKTTNGVEPYAGSPADPLQAEIKSTEDLIRPANSGVGTDYGATLQSILYPNEYAVNLSDTSGKAAYLGVETGGATGSKFGGRDPGDDVVDISLGALFGNTLSQLGVLADDNEENACLSSDHVAQAPSQTKTSTFPYLASPH
jgi:hypothetical protein